jgi:NAD(P)-dependent dehydrogenase (short-subunit alcohol dehydrogenase family)
LVNNHKGADEFMNELFSLKEKVIVLTGGAGYLGSRMAKALINFGATVVVPYTVEKKPEEIIGENSAIENLHIIKCNLASTESIREMFKNAAKICGRIDVLVNCAAYGGGSGGKSVTATIDSTPDDIWDLGIEGTLDITYKCTREVLPYFYENGKGNIINIASMYGMVSPDPGIYGTTGQNSPPMYGAGKAAVLQLTRYSAGHLASRNIRVNSITPGPFPNPKGSVNEDFMSRLSAKTMLRRTGRPEELAGALILLASDASSYMTGSNIVVDGGWTAW